MINIADYFSKLNIELSDKQVEQLNTYYEMLFEKNKVMNLTAITDYDDVVIKHFADSAAIASVFDLKNVNSIIDIGTGAGFPGLVLKIVFPKLKVTLLDSLNKRINFLNDVITSLGLVDVVALHGRAEDYGINSDFREKYDMCVSRAVANLSSLSEYCIPFVKVKGYFVAYKANGCEVEIKQAGNAIGKLGSLIENVKYFNLPDTDIDRCFVIVKKTSNTPKKYPRKAGLPTKEPLI